jgi:phage regulator Rha-like protein
MLNLNSSTALSQYAGITRAVVTMTSREIAELTGKDLAHIHRDIRVMLDELGQHDPVLDHPREDKDARGYTVCYHLNRELTETLLTGYSAVLRIRVIRRLHELEANQAPATASRALVSPIEAKLSEQLGIAALLQIPLHVAQAQAVKVIKLEMGTDLSPWLKLAPAQDAIPIDDMMLEPTELGARFGLSAQATNKRLAGAGLQDKVNGIWTPTALGAGRSAIHHWVREGKSGYNYKWRVAAVSHLFGGAPK